MTSHIRVFSDPWGDAFEPQICHGSFSINKGLKKKMTQNPTGVLMNLLASNINNLDVCYWHTHKTGTYVLLLSHYRRQSSFLWILVEHYFKIAVLYSKYKILPHFSKISFSSFYVKLGKIPTMKTDFFSLFCATQFLTGAFFLTANVNMWL